VSTYYSLSQEVEELYEEYVGLNNRVEELEGILYELESDLIFDAIEHAGQEIARELGCAMPGAWRTENNRILELLYEVYKEVENQCHRISAARRS